MQALRRNIATTLANRMPLQPRYETETFYMGDPADLDAVTSLYFGTLSVEPAVEADGQSVLRWRVDMPWVWPTYDELRKKYGDPHAQNFALPNLRSQLFGPQYMLRIDDGLGGHLPKLGLAKPFHTYAEWDEAWKAK